MLQLDRKTLQRALQQCVKKLVKFLKKQKTLNMLRKPKFHKSDQNETKLSYLAIEKGDEIIFWQLTKPAFNGILYLLQYFRILVSFFQEITVN